MNRTEFSEAKTLWKMFYASDCFRKARETAEHVFKVKLENNNALFYPLVSAVYVLYGRPFTNCFGVGALDEAMVPKEHLEQHKVIITHRHKIYAHTDANAFPLADYGPPSQVRVRQVLHGNRLSCQLFATDFYARYTAMPPIIELCKVLEEKTSYHVDKQFAKHRSKIAKTSGEFVLNILDEKKDMWLREKPMMDY